jgi:hypothetical protein
MEPWVMALVASLASIVASSGFWAYLAKRSTISSALRRLLLGMAYDKILSRGMSYIERGWISEDEYEEFRKYLWEPYSELGGNGVAQRIMDGVSTLPLRSHRKFAEIIPAQREKESRHVEQ